MAKTNFYTGKGDRGDTARLGSVERIPKSGILIEAVGSVDEATAMLGMARALTRTDLMRAAIPVIQRHMIRLMSHLSATMEQRSQYAGLCDPDIDWLEELISQIERDLPPLRDFVLPGDSQAGAAFHVARTMVRRAERRLVALAEIEPSFGSKNLAYINRLSSLLFAAAVQEDLIEKGTLRPANQALDQ